MLLAKNFGGQPLKSKCSVEGRVGGGGEACCLGLGDNAQVKRLGCR